MRVLVSVWNAIDDIRRKYKADSDIVNELLRQHAEKIAELEKTGESNAKKLNAVLTHLGLDVVEEVIPEVKAQPEIHKLVLKKREVPPAGPVA